MGRFSSMLEGLTRTFSTSKRGNCSTQCDAKEAAEAMAKDAKKNDMIIRSSGSVNLNRSNNCASLSSKKGAKGVNQDCCIVWEEFGCQEDMMFCGVFDGHGTWGHFVAKRVCNSFPSLLLCNWQEMLAEASIDPDLDSQSDKKLDRSNLWRNLFIKTCADIDLDLELYRKIDSVYSGTTAVAAIKQGDHLAVANVGDSRAVLATVDADDCLVPVQLTVDFKPNLPEEAERIIECNGRVFCLDDEPGLHRVWLPNEESPGLAMSRAFGDYCLKKFGLISVPQVIQRQITSRDQFMVLASDGVWDVVSNEEAVEIVSSTTDKAKSAKRLVDYAIRAWKRKRRTIATDDMSAICIFFHTKCTSSHQIYPVATAK
ncbi:probable protein phosphatase 2C 34 [Rutidosis leptorrhynchoides]|uniref:probable protein phosphatase 2C 34 n=1 Tax=Rutidosis leptorrhynchoides TaxID=125765 RepID=UPI003A9A4A32